MRTKPQLPCTGRVSTEGFPAFAAGELGESRRNLRLLEGELRQLLTAPFVTLVNSGSSANLAAAIWVKQRCGNRRRVLMSGFSFPTTISSYTLLGFDVRLVDTEPDDFNLDPGALGDELNDQVAAVVVTHFLGFPARLGRIAAATRKCGALLVQDACETMNLRVEGTTIYEYGDLVTHSFYHPHHLSSFGGGAVIAQLPEVHNQVQSIVHWGRSCCCQYDSAHCHAPAGLNHNFWYQQEGINVEMSELNACFGRWQLQSWPKQEAKRWKHWHLWEQAVAGMAGTRTWQASADISPFVYPIGVEFNRYAMVTDKITANGVEVRSLMGGAIHLHPAFQHLAHDRLKQCERTGSQSFFVGMHQTLETKKVQQAIAIVCEALRKT